MEFICLQVDPWKAHAGLLHGFLGRRGGKSVGPYAGLNLSYRVGDDNKVVSQNVCDMKAAVGIHSGRVVTMKQVHGEEIVDVKDRNLKEAGEADGMLTREREIYLGVLTADCVPILFVAPAKKLVAAVHAGWRGTLAGIAVKTVKMFLEEQSVLPSELEVALGPSIDACCYEIGKDVAQPLLEKWGAMAEANVQLRDGKSYLHLRNFNQAMLHHAGIPQSQIYQIGPCTCCAADDFFSYRREKKETGRQMSLIGWHP